jgi:hypothetical protein
MPFPFMPVGAIVAAALLGAVLTVFVWTLMALDRMASRAADSVVSGLVSGLRGWSADRPFPPDPKTPARPPDDPPDIADQPVHVDRVRPTIH